MSGKLWTSLLAAVVLSLIGLSLWFTGNRGPERETGVQVIAVDHPAENAGQAGEDAPPPLPEKAIGEDGAPAAGPPGRPGAGWVVAGRVLTPEGGPAPGVAVRLGKHPRRAGSREFPGQEVLTAADGRFELSELPGRIALQMEIDEPGSALRVLSFELRMPRGTETVYLGEFALEPPHPLRIRLEDPSGMPVEGAEALAVRSSFPGSDELEEKGFRESRREVKHAGKGEYILERVPPGDLEVETVARGFARKPNSSSWIRIPREGHFLIKLEESGRIAGAVRDQEGRPISGARLRASGSERGQYYGSVPVGDDGRFDLDFLLKDSYEISIDAKGFASSAKGDIATGTTDLDFVLKRAVVFSGRVVAEDDDSPLYHATVYLSYTERREDRLSGFNTQTDREGYFEFDRAEAGTYRVSAHHEGFLPTPDAFEIELEEGKPVTAHVIRLGRGLSVSGVVRDARTGDPIADAEVSFNFVAPDRKKGRWRSSDMKEGRTGKDGAFSVSGLAEGEHELRCSAKGFFPAEMEKMRVAPGERVELELTLVRGGAISGRVVDEGGNPVPGADVRARAPSLSDEHGFDMDAIHSKTDRAGLFTVVGLPAAADYEVEAAHGDYSLAEASGIRVDLGRDVSGVEIRLSGGGSIRGRVLDSKATGLGKARIYVSEEDLEGRDHFRAGGESNEDGTFLIEHLRPGTYTVQADSPKRKRSERKGIRVEEGSLVSGVDLVLAEGNAITGRVIDAEGSPVEEAEVRLSGHGIREYTIDSATTGPDGRYSVTWSDEGSIYLSARKPGYENAYPGEKTDLHSAGEVTLVLVRSGVLAGVVRAPGGESLEEPVVAALRQWSPHQDQRRAKVDPSGRFEVAVGEGTHVIQGSAKGFSSVLSEPFSLRAGQRREGIIVDLVPEARVEGRILRGGTREPIAEARVTVAMKDPRFRDLPGEETSADGRFSLQGVPPGPFALIVEYSRNRTRTFSGFSVNAGEKKEIEVEVESSGGIRGRVRKGGRGLEKATVYIRIEEKDAQVRESVETGIDGQFGVLALSPGEYQLSVSEGFVGPWPWSVQPERRVTVEEGKTTEIELDLDQGTRFRGRLASRGRALSGYSVRALHLETGTRCLPIKTDHAGQFELLLPLGGNYSFCIRGEGTNELCLEFNLPEGSREQEASFDLPASGIAGSVVDAGGNPVSQAVVEALLQNGNARSSAGSQLAWDGLARADSKGRFFFPHLFPEVYLLWVWGEGYAAEKVPGIRVLEGKVIGDLKIVLEPERRLSVRVIDEGGFPLDNVCCVARDSEGDTLPWARSWLRTDASGHFELERLEVGRYLLTLLGRGYAPREVEIRVGEEPMEQATVRLSKGGHLQVLTVDREGRALEEAVLTISDARGKDLSQEIVLRDTDGNGLLRTGSGGSLVLEDLSPGNYRITARKGGARSAERTSLIEARKIAEVRLELAEP